MPNEFDAVDPNATFSFSDDAVDAGDMESVQAVLASGEEQAQAENQALMEIQTGLVTAPQLAAFLKASYQAHGVFTYPDVWKQDDAWFLDVATGILDDVNRLILRFSALGHAIHAVDAAGSWGRLCLDYGGRWYMVLELNKAKKQKQIEDQEHSFQS